MLMQLTRLNTVLDIFDTEQEALAAIAAHRRSDAATAP
jgi:hypothetical protein